MFIIRTIITKPAGTKFRTPQLISGTTLQLGQWTKQQNGVTGSRTRRLGKNKIVNTVVFTDQAAADAYLAALATNTEYQARQEYNAANGITIVTRKYQEIV